MTITPDQARELLAGTTPGPWEMVYEEWENPEGIPCESWTVCDKSDGLMDATDFDAATHDPAANTALAAAAPDMAQAIAGMTEEWGVETKSHQFGLHWEWYDNEAAAKKAHGYQVDIWRARNRQKVMPIRRRFIMEVIEGE